MFLRRTAKTVIYRRICLGHTSEKFMVSAKKFARVIKISQVLVSDFTTPFSGSLQGGIYKNTKQLEAAIFSKEAPSQMLEWVENRLLAKGLKN